MRLKLPLCRLFLAATGLVSAPAFGLSLDELKAELAKHPELNWHAGETGMDDQFHAHGTKVGFGLDPAYRAHEIQVSPAAFRTPVGLPAQLDWRDKDGKNWMTPIRNQGKCGSCVAFAAVGTMEGQYNIAGGAPGLNVDFSEQDLFSRIGSCDMGSSPDEAVTQMQSGGIPDETCFPYVSGRTGVDQDTSLTCTDSAARSVKISDYQSVDASGAKAALQNGPLLTTMTVYEDLMYYTGGVYKHVTGNVEGGHAIVIVGYDDAAGAWIVRNSWGTSWGEAGYFRIAYDDVSGLANSNFAITMQNNSYASLQTPNNLQAVSGPLTLRGLNVRKANYGLFHYTLTGQGVDGIHAGALDRTTLSDSFDSTQLPDGTYVLKADVDVGGKASLPWYQVLEVVNHAQNIAVQVDPDAFDNTKPVTDRVYFKIHVTQATVPLTHAKLMIEKTDGSLSKVQVYENPGTDSSVGWRTKAFPNGTYKISVLGLIGDLQTFKSNSLTVTVAN